MRIQAIITQVLKIHIIKSLEAIHPLATARHQPTRSSPRQHSAYDLHLSRFRAQCAVHARLGSVLLSAQLQARKIQTARMCVRWPWSASVKWRAQAAATLIIAPRQIQIRRAMMKDTLLRLRNRAEDLAPVANIMQGDNSCVLLCLWAVYFWWASGSALCA